MPISNSNPVSWIPAHPAYGSLSMARYAKLLQQETRPEDPFQCNLILPHYYRNLGSKGKLQKFATRKVFYPIIIRRRCEGRIAHILDHSWSDMIPYLPSGTKKIVTVHDLIPLRFPGELTPAQAARFRGCVAHLHRADKIIAVSNYTRNEIIDLLKIDPSKIHVIPNGVHIPKSIPHRRPTTTDRSFRVGSIGSTLRRKNLEILPAALSRLRDLTGQRIVLVRAGAPLPVSLANEIRHQIGEHNLLEMGIIPDEELDGFYAGIDVLAVTSLYEGFGLPVLEGLAARVPVVASNTTSLPEVGFDMAFYFDPLSPEELSFRLARIATDGVPELHIDAAYQRAREFSWRQCLERVYHIYEGTLESK